ncbi:MAG: 16S rRNA (guanine(527)-N(7))-methyltransferase RsmG [Alphaproteobacteria bacterium]|nr:16S rRNA (guanine(527)-N(7))-methyltransferase RsmG [Alphaproteobacteria bacterium]
MCGASPPAAVPEATPLDAEAFRRESNVSRETLARLKIYGELLRRWQNAINLIGPATLADIWRRHFLDSWQLLPLAPPGARRWADLGSGAGFPGLVLAILGVPDMHLVESDGRKCAFLAEVARETRTNVQIHRARIETLAPLEADIITARALAPLERLLGWSHRHAAPGATCLFLKGREVERELTLAAESWTLQFRRHPSRSDPAGIVLEVKGFHRV